MVVRRATTALTPEQHVELLEASARIAGVAAYEWDLSGLGVWSDEFFRLLGHDPVDDELTADAFFGRVHPEDVERVAGAYRAAQEGPSPPMEYRIVRPDGTTRFVRGTMLLATRPGSSVPRYVGAIVDVTERYEAETRAQMWLHALEESQRIGGIGTFVVVPATKDIQWSPGLYRLNGVPLGEKPTPERALMYVHPEDVGKQAPWFRQIVREGTAPPLYTRVRHPEHGLRHLMGYGARVRLADGVDRVIGTTIDVTERMTLEEQLRHGARMEAVGTLAAGVAHDFNNYLTVIGASLEVLVRALPVEAAESLENVRYGLDRCATLTRQLLALARAQPARPRMMDLRSAIATAARILAPGLGERIALEVVVPSEAVVVEADPAHLEQVIVNLATNARDAMPDGGRLSLRLKVADGAASADAKAQGHHRRAELEVEDDGDGIAAEHVGRVFEPYFTTKAPGSGSGLGLASVYGTVRQHLGTVEVRSEIGVGTTFTVFLPLRDGPLEAITPSEVPELPRGRGRIMIVEDMPQLRRVLAQALVESGYEAVEARDAVSALALLEQGRFDVVVSDVVMPGMTGAALYREIERRVPGTPVVLMSGYAGDALGAKVVLSKPFAVADLLRAIEACLATR